MKIRLALDEDLDKVIKLSKLKEQETKQNTIILDKPLLALDIVAVAVDNGSIVGYGIYFLDSYIDKSNTDTFHKYVKEKEFFALPQYKQKGVYRQLMSHLKNYTKKIKLKELTEDEALEQSFRVFIRDNITNNKKEIYKWKKYYTYHLVLKKT